MLSTAQSNFLLHVLSRVPQGVVLPCYGTDPVAPDEPVEGPSHHGLCGQGGGAADPHGKERGQLPVAILRFGTRGHHHRLQAADKLW